MPPLASAIILAAGRSTRFGEDKQFTSLLGRPVLARSIQAFEDCDPIGEIIVVAGEQNMGRVNDLIARYGWRKILTPVLGGERRQDSVINGLRSCAYPIVAVHDGARPLVTPDMIERGLAAGRDCGAAIAAVPATDTIKVVGDNCIILDTPDRSALRLAQTPQIFRRDLLEEAYALAARDGTTVTDDASAIELLGKPVKVFMGSYDNIKITSALDLTVAAALLKARDGQETAL